MKETILNKSISVYNREECEEMMHCCVQIMCACVCVYPWVLCLFFHYFLGSKKIKMGKKFHAKCTKIVRKNYFD